MMMPKKVFDPSVETDWIPRLETILGTDSVRYLLSNPGDTFLAEQLHCYPRAAKKFPGWHRTGMAYLKTALEQSSGETAARHKAFFASEIGIAERLRNHVSIQPGKMDVLLDLSGGLGMDTLAFAEIFRRVHYVDPNPSILAIARHNHRLHGCENVTYHCGSAEDLLPSLPEADWIYIDPSRRNPNRRVFLLNDSQPDVPSMWPMLRSKAAHIMLKLSPMYDLEALKHELPDVNRITVVSVNAEVKEILAISTPDATISTEAVCLPKYVRITGTSRQSASGSSLNITSLQPGMMLYRVDPAIIKAGLLPEFATENSLSTLTGLSSLLSGQEDKPIDAADAYKILKIEPYKPRQLKKNLEGLRVNIHAYGFPVKAEDLYKTLSTDMGDHQDLFFVNKGKHGKKDLMVIFAKKR
jgi:hypothetical protein